ncbi:hypothetical protein EASAB2608_00434 [Streptomyces sp. EAS-AB2608]|nr:hypothetical protein EASAB2608_00434 [Streptomyces sp. EAS-AB2608]
MRADRVPRVDTSVADDQLCGVVGGLGNQPADRHGRHECGTSFVELRLGCPLRPGSASEEGEEEADLEAVSAWASDRWTDRDRCALTLGPGEAAVCPVRAPPCAPQRTRRAAGGRGAL